MAVSIAPARAATFYWSGDGTTQGGSGPWDTTIASFGTAAAGPYTTIWDNAVNAGDTAVFGGVSGTVTLDAEIAVRQLTLNAGMTITGASPLNGGTAALAVGIGGSTDRAVGGAITTSIVGSGGMLVTGSRGPLVLGAANAFSGMATFGGGSGAGTVVVQFDNAAAVPTTANLNLRNGVVMLTAASGNFSRSIGTAANQVQFESGGGGFAALGGDRTVTLGASTISWNGTNSFVKTSPFVMSSAAADSTITLTNGLNLSNGTRFVQVNNGAAAVDAVISGPIGVSGGTNGNLTKSGLGTLALTASNLLSGSVSVTAGMLQLGNSGSTGSFANARAISVGGNGTFATNRTNAITQGTHFPVISGAGGFTHAGSGTTLLTATNTYTGPTSATAGTLALAAGGSVNASARVTIAANAVFDVAAVGTYVVPTGQTLAGSGTIVGTVATGSGATLSPGASPGTLSFAGDLTWNGAGNYNWQMLSGTGVAGAADAWDLVNVTGALAIDATSADPFRINLWTLSAASPDVSGTAANFDPSQNYTWRIATAAGGISGFAADKFTIATSATNGTGGFANSVGSGTFGVALDGTNLNLVYTAGAPPAVVTISVVSGTQTQTAAGYPLLSGTTPVVKTGAGTLVIDQANTLTGSTTVQAGRLQLSTASALGASRVVPLAGGTVTLSPFLQTTVGGLAANAGGLTDVGNGFMTVAAGLTTADMLTALVAGRGDGSWNGTSGITSSQAAADLTVNIPRTVGWLDNGDGSVSFAFAAAGDTNLDWAVDILDAANFLAAGKFDSGLPASWNEGDFGYDGMVDILDAADFLSTGLFDAGSYNSSGQVSVAAVPEPSGMAATAVVAAIVFLRRRR
jgi:fibronectin-binding autotransporter adhesin